MTGSKWHRVSGPGTASGYSPSPVRRCLGVKPEAGPQTPLGILLVSGQKATVTPATEPEPRESWVVALENSVCRGLPRAPGPTGPICTPTVLPTPRSILLAGFRLALNCFVSAPSMQGRSRR